MGSGAKWFAPKLGVLGCMHTSTLPLSCTGMNTHEQTSQSTFSLSLLSARSPAPPPLIPSSLYLISSHYYQVTFGLSVLHEPSINAVLRKCERCDAGAPMLLPLDLLPPQVTHLRLHPKFNGLFHPLPYSLTTYILELTSTSQWTTFHPTSNTWNSLIHSTQSSIFHMVSLTSPLE